MPAQDLPPSGEPWPTEIRLSKDRKTLTIGFDTGESFALAAEYLRVKSPSAESWDYLRDLGRNHAAYWQDYLDDLAAKGMAR